MASRPTCASSTLRIRSPPFPSRMAPASFSAPRPTFPPEPSSSGSSIPPSAAPAKQSSSSPSAANSSCVPDNGLITMVADRDGVEGIREIANPDWMIGAKVSSTFHGRDIFSPVGAHLARGDDWTQVGPELKQLVRLDLHPAVVDERGLTGEVIALDGPFGNLVTNISADDFLKLGYQRGDSLKVTIAGRDDSNAVCQDFQRRSAQEAVALHRLPRARQLRRSTRAVLRPPTTFSRRSRFSFPARDINAMTSTRKDQSYAPSAKSHAFWSPSPLCQSSCSSHASAQSFRGSIRGTVTDPSGGALPNAKVNAKNIATGLQREATTGPDGGYVIAELPAGEYTVTAQAAQLSPAAQNVQVNVGLDTTANFDLTQRAKSHPAGLVTAEDVPLVETTPRRARRNRRASSSSTSFPSTAATSASWLPLFRAQRSIPPASPAPKAASASSTSTATATAPTTTRSMAPTTTTRSSTTPL